jgi:hypothetical protein
MNWLILAEADSSDTGLKIIGAIWAVVIPFVSVYVAQYMGRQQRKRELALDCFRTVAKDLRTMNDKFAECYAFWVTHNDSDAQQRERVLEFILEISYKRMAMQPSLFVAQLLFGKRQSQDFRSAVIEYSDLINRYSDMSVMQVVRAQNQEPGYQPPFMQELGEGENKIFEEMNKLWTTIEEKD